MKRYVICALAAIALALNAQAEPKDKDKPPKDKDKDNGAVYSVPDTGSTVLLLGSALLVLGVASRRFATRSTSQQNTKARPGSPRRAYRFLFLGILEGSP